LPESAAEKLADLQRHHLLNCLAGDAEFAADVSLRPAMVNKLLHEATPFFV